MKVLAMYLPQFHRVKENDQWWGTGFTEWTAAKGAEKLYEGHYQPRIPKNQYYYNLLDKDAMKWQADLMKKYGVDGACIYHYWFKDSRRILEKPAENLLKWKSIEMPFCFYWANVTWARTWSNLQNKTPWTNAYEPDTPDETNGILLEQKYGEEKHWREHFKYLLPFFQDERYIKIDGKPLFMIYVAEDIPCLADMLDCWENLAVEYGWKGLYIIGSRCKFNREKCIDAEICLEPSNAFRLMQQARMENSVRVFNYDDFWRKILDTPSRAGTYFQGVVGYDDTPRRGKEGCVIEGATPDKFAGYLTELMAKSCANNSDIVFINAWNEWGEGMYLEPDEKYGEEFLAAIPYAKNNYMSYVEKYKMSNSDDGQNNELNHLKGQLDKERYYLKILDHWMTLRENGFSVKKRLIDLGYKKIALYGYSILGRHLYNELEGSEAAIQYLIDRQGDNLHLELPVYLPTDSLPKADVVIVASTYYYSEIYHFLKEKGIKRIISLETILKEF